MPCGCDSTSTSAMESWDGSFAAVVSQARRVTIRPLYRRLSPTLASKRTVSAVTLSLACRIAEAKRGRFSTSAGASGSSSSAATVLPVETLRSFASFPSGGEGSSGGTSAAGTPGIAVAPGAAGAEEDGGAVCAGRGVTGTGGVTLSCAQAPAVSTAPAARAIHGQDERGAPMRQLPPG